MSSIRKENLEKLSQKGFLVADSLPVNRLEPGEIPQLRPIEEIFGRLIALKSLWLYVDDYPEGVPSDVVEDMINTYNVKSFLTEEENEILQLSRAEAEKTMDI